MIFPDPTTGWSGFSDRSHAAEKNMGDLKVLTLQENEYDPARDTDLLLHFNEEGQGDEMGNYTLKNNWTRGTGNSARRGNGSAVFQNRDDGILLEGGPESLFTPNHIWQDFTLEFWLYPANVQDGETIFLWKGAERMGREFQTQEVRISLQGRRVLWKFDQFFENYPKKTLVLTGTRSLLPRTWHHHLIRFNSHTGLLEYLVDGVPENSLHVTPSGREEAQVFLPRIGKSSQSLVYIGPNLTAIVDEFRLTGTFQEQINPQRFTLNTGTLLSRILDLGTRGSSLTRIKTLMDIPGKTGVLFSYLLAENKKYHWQANGSTKEGLKVELLPDGTGTVTPGLREIKITYRQNQPPPPPPGLLTHAGEGKITLLWKPVTREGLRGYMVYYGTAPRMYNPTPVDAGNTQEVTIEGLENNRLYYFALVSYDDSAPPLLSPFSEEVSARPVRSRP